MALYLLEGFETYAGLTGASLQTAMEQIWSDPSPTSGTDAYIIGPGRGDTGACLFMPDSNSNVLAHHCGVQAQTWIVGFAIYLPGGVQAQSNYHMYQARDNLGDEQLKLGLGYTNNLQVWLSGAVHQTSAPFTFRMNQWNFVEMKYTIDASGSYEVRVNGVTVLSATGVDTDWTDEGEVSAHWFKACADSQQLDDIYICDDSGPELNDWLGHNYTVVALLPDGDTAQLDWSVEPVGNHYQTIDDSVGNTSDYVYDNVTSNTDLYDYDDMPVTPTSILVIDVWTQTALDIVGSESLISTCKSGTTNSDGSPETITETDYTTRHRLISQDPDTAAAWTGSGLNAAQFGVKIG